MKENCEGAVLPVSVKIKKLTENAVIPTKAHASDMGMDIVATSVEYNADMDCYVYHTGLAFELPVGYGMLIFPRSSNRKTNCYMTNSVGILDSGYRGELLVCFKDRTAIDVESTIHTVIDFLDDLSGIYDIEEINDILVDVTGSVEYDKTNRNNVLHSAKAQLEDIPYKVGDRIAQIVIVPYPQICFNEVDTLNDSDRGEGGHGSTGN